MRRFALLLLLAACKGEGEAPGKGPGGKRPEMRFPVEVLKVESTRVEYNVSAVGSVEAFERVQVVARVAGAVEEVRFREGNTVGKGQVLARIEPERYELGVRVARAQEERADATMKDAEAGFKRREAAVRERPDLIPAEELEAWRTKVHVAESSLAEARARREQAELNYRSANASAPVAGVIETKNVDTGQYVQAGTLIATLVRRDPLLLRFKVPERDAGAFQAGAVANAKVAASPTLLTAKVTHVGQAADTASRMVSVVAELEAPPAALRPGSFAEIVVPIGSADQALSVPELAVRPSERGFIAFVVEDNTARERMLTLGLRTGDGRVEVSGGLKEGDLVVVRGNEALFDGAPVRVAEGQVSEPPSASQRMPAPPDAVPQGEEPKDKKP